MKTQQELQLHYWGPHYDMVKEYNAKHGCDVKPWECVKWRGIQSHDDHPGFNDSEYTFALTILYDDKRKEHRPVFVGDKIYDKNGTGDPWTISYPVSANFEAWNNWSWNPPTPKRTFKIEIDKKQLELLITATRPFCTGNHWSELFTLLTEARDKE